VTTRRSLEKECACVQMCGNTVVISVPSLALSHASCGGMEKEPREIEVFYRE
jgi:hypothetical protein